MSAEEFNIEDYVVPEVYKKEGIGFKKAYFFNVKVDGEDLEKCKYALQKLLDLGLGLKGKHIDKLKYLIEDEETFNDFFSDAYYMTVTGDGFGVAPSSNIKEMLKSGNISMFATNELSLNVFLKLDPEDLPYVIMLDIPDDFLAEKGLDTFPLVTKDLVDLDLEGYYTMLGRLVLHETNTIMDAFVAFVQLLKVDNPSDFSKMYAVFLIMNLWHHNQVKNAPKSKNKRSATPDVSEIAEKVKKAMENLDPNDPESLRKVLKELKAAREDAQEGLVKRVGGKGHSLEELKKVLKPGAKLPDVEEMGLRMPPPPKGLSDAELKQYLEKQLKKNIEKGWIPDVFILSKFVDMLFPDFKEAYEEYESDEDDDDENDD